MFLENYILIKQDKYLITEKNQMKIRNRGLCLNQIFFAYYLCPYKCLLLQILRVPRLTVHLNQYELLDYNYHADRFLKFKLEEYYFLNVFGYMLILNSHYKKRTSKIFEFAIHSAPVFSLVRQ